MNKDTRDETESPYHRRRKVLAEIPVDAKCVFTELKNRTGGNDG